MGSNPTLSSTATSPAENAGPSAEFGRGELIEIERVSGAELPPAAVTLAARIEAMLDEADAVLARVSVVDETTYALRETRRRYLPDTLSSYLDIPPSQRDGASQEMLVGQLTILERGTAQRLAALAESSRVQQEANGAFLADKFGRAESLPPAPETIAPGATPPPHVLVSRLFDRLDANAHADPPALVDDAARRFSAVLPGITTVKRGLFGGAAKTVVLDVPRQDHVLRYSLSLERTGLETLRTKVVRGIALRTERVAVGDWLAALYEDVAAFVERDRASRDLLANFFRH